MIRKFALFDRPLITRSSEFRLVATVSRAVIPLSPTHWLSMISADRPFFPPQVMGYSAFSCFPACRYGLQLALIPLSSLRLTVQIHYQYTILFVCTRFAPIRSAPPRLPSLCFDLPLFVRSCVASLYLSSLLFLQQFVFFVVLLDTHPSPPLLTL